MINSFCMAISPFHLQDVWNASSTHADRGQILMQQSVDAASLPPNVLPVAHSKHSCFLLLQRICLAPRRKLGRSKGTYRLQHKGVKLFIVIVRVRPCMNLNAKLILLLYTNTLYNLQDIWYHINLHRKSGTVQCKGSGLHSPDYDKKPLSCESYLDTKFETRKENKDNIHLPPINLLKICRLSSSNHGFVRCRISYMDWQRLCISF